MLHATNVLCSIYNLFSVWFPKTRKVLVLWFFYYIHFLYFAVSDCPFVLPPLYGMVSMHVLQKNLNFREVETSVVRFIFPNT